MWIDLYRMLVSSNLTAPPFIYYIQCYKIVLMFYNGLGIAEVRDLEAENFNLAQKPNRNTND